MDLGDYRAPRSSHTGLSGRGLSPLHSITSGTDYSETLFGRRYTGHSGDPASWEDSLRATHCCTAHISHRRQRKSRRTTSMLTDLKHFKPSQTWTDLLKCLSLKELTLSIHISNLCLCSNSKSPLPSFSGNPTA